MRTAMVSAHSLASRLMDRVARPSMARSAVATWSTPGEAEQHLPERRASEISAPTVPASHCRRASAPVSTAMI